MELYKIGKIVSINKNYLILESNYSGHLIYIPNSERFTKDETCKLYVFHYENEYNKTTYGFESFRERFLFEDLISISGIGPKTAIAFLNSGWEKGMHYIANGDWENISKYPYIGIKSAKQLVFEFQNKYKKVIENIANFQKNKTNTNEDKGNDIEEVMNTKLQIEPKMAFELEDTLKILGFKKKQIDYAIANLKPSDNFELLIEEAIKIISHAREFRN